MPVADVNKVKQRKEWEDELRNTNHSTSKRGLGSSSNHRGTKSPGGGRKPRINQPPPRSPSSPKRSPTKRVVSPPTTWKSPYGSSSAPNTGGGGGGGINIAPPPFGGGGGSSHDPLSTSERSQHSRTTSRGGGVGDPLSTSGHSNNGRKKSRGGTRRKPAPQFPEWESAMSMGMEELSPRGNGGLHHSMPPVVRERSPKRPQQRNLGGSMPIKSSPKMQRSKSPKSPKKKSSSIQRDKSPIRHSAAPDIESQIPTTRSSTRSPKISPTKKKKSSIQRDKSPLRHSAPPAAPSSPKQSPKKKLSVQKSPVSSKSAPPQSPTSRSPKKKVSIQKSPKSSSSPKKKKVVVLSPTTSPIVTTPNGSNKKKSVAADGSIPGPPLESSSSPVPLRKEAVIDGKRVIIQQVPVRSKSEAELIQRRPSILREKMKNMKGVSFLKSKLAVEEKPPRTLVAIWIIMSVELAFDLTTTWIAFNAFLNVEDCCGVQIELGPIPLSSTIPFLLLVLAELAFMLRAVQLTLWPSLEHTPLDENERHSIGRRIFSGFMCCLKWNARRLMNLVNMATVINPFLSCIVAWMLMYGSDKTEAFTVLVLEGVGIILHIISVVLEGDFDTKWKIIWHFIIPFIPLVISVSLCLIYLKEGGVCYLVDKKVFLFTGCEVCPDTGYPPIDGYCGNVTVGGNLLDTIVGADAASDLTGRDYQDTYCYENGDPPIYKETNFCWFPYD